MKTNNISIKVTDPFRLAKDALDEHLYVSGWMLKRQLELIYYLDKDFVSVTDEDLYDIAVAYDKQQAIGVIVLDNKSFNTFVKNDYRRQKIGSLLYKAITAVTKRDYSKIPMGSGGKGKS